MSRGKLVVVMVATLAVAVPLTARAGGLLAGDSGSQAQQRAGAFVAKADDPTAMLHNPAGLLGVKRWELYIGVNLVDYDHTFDRTGVYAIPEDGVNEPYTGDELPSVSDEAAPLPVPFLAVVGRFGGNLAIAAGVFGPQGQPNREFKEQVTTAGGSLAPGPQRYDIISQNVLLALPSIAVAYRVLPQLDVGVRASWGFASLKATSSTWAKMNLEGDAGNDGLFKLDVSDPFVFGFGAGVLYRATKNISVGLSYNSSMHIQAKGRGEAYLGDKIANAVPGEINEIVPLTDAEGPACAPGGTGPTNLKACLDAATPQVVTVGGRYVLLDGKGGERADVELDVRWENWAQTRSVGLNAELAVADIRVVVDGKSKVGNFFLNPSDIRHGFEDVWAIRLGGQYRLPIGAHALLIRAGGAYDMAAAPDSWTRLDIDGASRITAAFGVAYEMKSFRIDLGGAGIFEPTRTVTQVPLADENDIDVRVQPDPIQPLEGTRNQRYDPINLGTHESGYWIATLGMTTWF